MESWHSYPKVYPLGHSAIAEILLDPVIVEEKVDGSQFSFGLFDDGLHCRSRGAQLVMDAPEGMFQRGVDVVSTLDLHPGWTYRAEYLQKPKHNSLAYARTPHKHLMIFDINPGHESYLGYADKAAEAARLGLECVPIVYEGLITGRAQVMGFIDRESVLGGAKVEGVVIKNYRRFTTDGKAMIGKHVSEAFKEIHTHIWKATNPNKSDVLQCLIDSLRTEARWVKAVQHIAEAGQLSNSPTDIGALIKEVQRDIEVEGADLIAKKLVEWAMPQIKRASTGGMPEWYKARLMESQQYATTEGAV